MRLNLCHNFEIIHMYCKKQKESASIVYSYFLLKRETDKKNYFFTA